MYDGTGQWFGTNVDASGNPTGSGDCTTVCPLTAITPNGNNMNDIKNGPYFYCLFSGIPDMMVPPIAVPEPYNTNKPAKQYYTTQTNFYPKPLSDCPYATIAYFSSSGNVPKLPQGPGGERFCDQWPAGSKLLVMVYDGTVSTSIPQAVTVVGYGIIQIDGYANNWNGHSVSGLGKSGNTAYGHAVKITDLFPSLAGDPHLTDPYIIQPVAGESCTDFLVLLKKIQVFQVKLVDSSNDMGYGMTTH